jgi:hypothetical protein
MSHLSRRSSVRRSAARLVQQSSIAFSSEVHVDRLSREVLERVLAACQRVESAGIRIVAHHRGLQVLDGVYTVALTTSPTCLPLEAVLLGRPSDGVLELDIARELAVSPAWVSGFLHGFALGDVTSPEPSGYADGLAFRRQHYAAG